MKSTKNKQNTKTKTTSRSELAGSHVRLRFSKHLMPPLAGLLVALSFFGFFDSQLLSGRIEYHLHSKQTNSASAIVTSAPVIQGAPRLIVNRLGLDVPITFEGQTSNAVFGKDLENGVVHYPGSALPGQLGNVVIFGRSSSQWWAAGNYKFVFNLLNKVVINDKIFLDYQGQQYAYNVYNTTVVAPTDLSVLNQSSNYTLTLMTSTPVGTDSERLVVIAQQYSPAVKNDYASAKPATLPTGALDKLPGNELSFWYDLGQLL